MHYSYFQTLPLTQRVVVKRTDVGVLRIKICGP